MYKASFTTYNLLFSFPAKTSRDILYEKQTYYIKLQENGKTGYGECSYINGLSLDDSKQIPIKLHEVCQQINDGTEISTIDLKQFPSISFALETAYIDLKMGGSRTLYPSDFTMNDDPMPINGLIWMGEEAFLKQQIIDKIESGFKCIKIKVGSQNPVTDLQILSYIRKEFSTKDIEIRLDANGAYLPENALDILKQFSDFSIHSIEQPIATNNHEALSKLVELSPIPIALDEELLPKYLHIDKEALLKIIKPNYIVIKPSLLGGFSEAKQWIDIANSQQINWWITSALESNIGLNALAQWTYSLNNKATHGLGTGQLYTNNIPSPIEIIKGALHHTHEEWDLSGIS